ncbi:estradiol 17-beta-dehydrogenase 8 [Apis cerana]|uniref:(3R)-3-hydroxyacyl-CoA dehydrogenase n=1 Tax=Apis cerana cerana TaxID=94128 RepID=A0A2A3EHF5_APICC|nr:estradiol 17-beta-dehydrogenase 8 [Apis cerana]PBC30606.1 Estradiol 17-beta-dehydrogenase [Apis cerana cerana]
MVAGKIAFVTGAGSGIGRKVCHILAKQGASVIATDLNLKNAEETIRSLNDTRHLALNVEVLNEQSIKEAFKNAINKYSTPPTIIVNSAGITSDQFILKLTNEDFDKVLNVNLKGTFFIIQTAVKEMINANVNKGGSIVNISSIIGKIGNMGQANYAASKAGVIALTKTASLEFGQFGIRVNTVLPGFIETPMTKTVPDNIKQLFIKRIPLHRMGKPEEVAEVITFLASSKSSYINGASIDVTGGLY